RLADETGDAGYRAALWTTVATVRAWTGPVDEAVQALDRAVTHTAGNPDCGMGVFGYSPLARLFLTRAELLALEGRLDEARQEAERGVALARERSEPEVIAWTL